MHTQTLTMPKGKIPPNNYVSKEITKKTKATKPEPVQSVAPKVHDAEIVNRYDYDKVADPAVRATLQDLETRIRKSLRQERTACLDIGNALLEAKAIKQFGDFENWVAKSFPDFSKRTSENYMAIAREFGDSFQLLSDLPSQTLYKLAAGKALKNVRAKVISAATSGNPIKKGEVQRLIAEASKAASKGKLAPKLEGSEADARMNAGRNAVALLRERLDDDFAKFVTMFHDAGEAFAVALKEAA